MTCEDLRARLEDLVDGELAVAEREAAREHLASCAGCREEERALRQLLAEARELPREIAPQRDLWPAIEARLSGSAPWSRRGLLQRPLVLAAAAVLLVGLSSALTTVLMGRLGPRRVVVVEQGPPPALQPATLQLTAASIDELESEYDQAAQALLASLEQRGQALAPETLRVVEENLDVIDRALAEVREALEQDPGNAGLMRMLAATHQKKIDVLQRVMRHRT